MKTLNKLAAYFVNKDGIVNTRREHILSWFVFICLTTIALKLALILLGIGGIMVAGIIAVAFGLATHKADVRINGDEADLEG